MSQQSFMEAEHTEILAEKPARPIPRDLEPDVLAKTAAIAEVLEKGKALNMVAFDISRVSTFSDVLFVVTAMSVRHAQALADQALAEASARKLGFLRMEGHVTGQWILLDLNDVIVNILLESTRELYRLEGLWAGCPLLYGSLDNNGD